MKKPTLLLSACCAPCATVALERLRADYDVAVFFWGNNIHPRGEYQLRQDAVLKLCPDAIIVEYQQIQPETCEQCFELRLRATAQYAIAQSFDFFATSLTTSPHKPAEVINRIGASISLKYIPTDFKKNDGFSRSVQLSNSLGLYRQNYCGCTRL
jgi:hypothetical protein